MEVKPGQLAELRGAALLVRIGLDHEPWLRARCADRGRRRASRPGGAADLDASRGIALLEAETPRVRAERGCTCTASATRTTGSTPRMRGRSPRRIQGALARLAPARRARCFEANRAALPRRLDAGLARWTRRLAPYAGTRVVVAHESWPYFARRFGLDGGRRRRADAGRAAFPAYLAALTARMKAAGVRLLIAEPSRAPRWWPRWRRASGARAVILIPSVGGDPEAARLPHPLRRQRRAPGRRPRRSR